VKTNDDIHWIQVAKEHDKVERFNIFDAVMWGMKASVEQHKHKQKETEK
jgi:hypothetical protein